MCAGCCTSFGGTEKVRPVAARVITVTTIVMNNILIGIKQAFLYCALLSNVVKRTVYSNSRELLDCAKTAALCEKRGRHIERDD